MINQYNSYGSISSDIQNIVANNVSLLDSYILMQTGENEYTALIYDNATKKTEQLRFYRTSGNYSSSWRIERTESTFDYQLTNEYYCYSNVGFGRSLSLPVYQAVTSFSLCSITVLLFFAVIFKGVLFRCLDRKR